MILKIWKIIEKYKGKIQRQELLFKIKEWWNKISSRTWSQSIFRLIWRILKRCKNLFKYSSSKWLATNRIMSWCRILIQIMANLIRNFHFSRRPLNYKIKKTILRTSITTTLSRKWRKGLKIKRLLLKIQISIQKDPFNLTSKKR